MKGINTKVLLYTMLAAVVISAALGIAQIWFNLFEPVILIKTLVTVLVVCCIAGFLMAVDYDMPSSPQKKILAAMVILVMTMGGLLLAQMWWLAIEWVAFAKIFGTVFILFVLVSFIAAIREDFGGQGKLKKDNFID